MAVTAMAAATTTARTRAVTEPLRNVVVMKRAVSNPSSHNDFNRRTKMSKLLKETKALVKTLSNSGATIQAYTTLKENLT